MKSALWTTKIRNSVSASRADCFSAVRRRRQDITETRQATAAIMSDDGWMDSGDLAYWAGR